MKIIAMMRKLLLYVTDCRLYRDKEEAIVGLETHGLIHTRQWQRQQQQQQQQQQQKLEIDNKERNDDNDDDESSKVNETTSSSAICVLFYG